MKKLFFLFAFILIAGGSTFAQYYYTAHACSYAPNNWWAGNIQYQTRYTNLNTLQYFSVEVEARGSSARSGACLWTGGRDDIYLRTANGNSYSTVINKSTTKSNWQIVTVWSSATSGTDAAYATVRW